MSNLTQQVKQGAEHALASLVQGWRELKDRASGALTRFEPKDQEDQHGDALQASQGRWGFMAVDVSDGENSVVVRVEAPGLGRSDLKVEMRGQSLIVQGEKRVDREFSGAGHYAVQSSYGSFSRVIPMPVAVSTDTASATYREGVLRIVLSKVAGAGPRRFSVNVNDGTES